MGVLTGVQAKLKAPKNQVNKFGGYKYRSCEDILEAVKPLLDECDATLTISDSIELIADRVYVKATATFKAGEEVESVTAYAREPLSKKGMDEPQITGTASSYARKYALNGLFLIDDTKDPDTNEYAEQQNKAKKQPIDYITSEQAARLNQLMVQYNDSQPPEKKINLTAMLKKHKVESVSRLTVDMANEWIKKFEGLVNG